MCSGRSIASGGRFLREPVLVSRGGVLCVERRRSRIGGCGCLAYTNVLEDRGDDIGIFDAGDDAQRATALGAGLDVDGEDAFQALHQVEAVVLATLCTELHRDVRALATEALGYYALPMPPERPGDNEAPLGGAYARSSSAYARSARKGLLAGLFAWGGTLDEQRDRLARRLLGARDTGESG